MEALKKGFARREDINKLENWSLHVNLSSIFFLVFCLSLSFSLLGGLLIPCNLANISLVQFLIFSWILEIFWRIRA